MYIKQMETIAQLLKEMTNIDSQNEGLLTVEQLRWETSWVTPNSSPTCPLAWFPVQGEGEPGGKRPEPQGMLPF